MMISGDTMTDKRMAEILRSITVIIDTREQDCYHLTRFFDGKEIKYIRRKLDFGDYSFEVAPISVLQLHEPFSFERRIAIERKHSLDELSGNLAQSRERFQNELTRAKDAGAKLILMVEGGSWDRIIEHKYQTDLNERSYMASLFSFIHRYNIEVQFIPSKYAGMFIFSQFYYMLREELKGLVV